ncbi:hypothetical protein AKO1_001889 [Acrasis kona]|uniref:PX domain-containing protein n=1 Tax=Acrasis kona TaxID=1008807 RepID=A0AAW2Z2A1_9EUKA
MNFGSESHQVSNTSLVYGDKLHLKSLSSDRYLCAEDNYSVNINRESAREWETFTMESRYKEHGQEVRYGDLINLKTNHNTFICADDQGYVVADRKEPQEWETFIIIDPNNIYNNNLVPSWGTVASFKSDHDRFLSANQNGEATTNHQLTVTEFFHVIQFGHSTMTVNHHRSLHRTLTDTLPTITHEVNYTFEPVYTIPVTQPELTQPVNAPHIEQQSSEYARDSAKITEVIEQEGTHYYVVQVNHGHTGLHYVHRRYKEFNNLHNKLVAKYPERMKGVQMPFPHFVSAIKKSDATVENRKSIFNHLLMHIMCDDILMRDQNVIEFLHEKL